ncbi:hypothetical protein AMK27_05525 [Streptomyces sp. CB02009]|nr:hypothetical protein AMK27_05525 [Streptomyces sp. CB02009]
MANWWRSVGNVFWAVDRALGGERRPTSGQKWAARRPVAAGLLLAVPFTLLFLALSSEGGAVGAALAVLGGLVMGVLFALAATAERLRQRRLKRRGLWDGS